MNSRCWRGARLASGPTVLRLMFYNPTYTNLGDAKRGHIPCIYVCVCLKLTACMLHARRALTGSTVIVEPFLESIFLGTYRTYMDQLDQLVSVVFGDQDQA